MLFLATTPALPTITLTPNLVISRSCKVRPRVYHIPGKDKGLDTPSHSVIVIRANHAVIDFSDATLMGDNLTTRPDQRSGIGIIVEGDDVTVENLKVRGYKVGLWAKHSNGLKLLNCDFSYNWKQHLGSTPEREDEADWQSYHQNEKDEWLQYGAGAYLTDTDNFEVKGCQATGGQCGLMMTRSNHGLVWNNDFSFLSGIGVGLYRSSFNRVMNNKIDWCVRGFSFGVYNRGQDSAGILIYEQSDHNVFAYNSVTQGGDGFFLWAGQSTMDTGKGGCNDNLVFGNDFSSAPTNGIEATFSRNTFADNLVAECDNGFWGGYSYDSVLDGNIFAVCHTGSAVEHSQNLTYEGNIFTDDQKNAMFWANPNADPNWGYPKHRDTRSMNVTMIGNTFINSPSPAISAVNTIGLTANDNRFVDTGGISFGAGSTGLSQSNNRVAERDFVEQPTGPEWDFVKGAKEFNGNLGEYLARFNWNPFKPTHDVQVENIRPKPLAGGMDPFIPKGARRGRRNILIDEWGPFDFRSPRFWVESDITGKSGETLTLKTLGPSGSVKISKVDGGRLVSSASLKMGDSVQVKLAGGRSVHLVIEGVYRGGRTVNEFGAVTPAGVAVPFSFSRDSVGVDWGLKFFLWDSATDPRTQEKAFDDLLTTKPFGENTASDMDLTGYGEWVKGLRNDHFAIDALGHFDVSKGKYRIEVTSDDGVRMFLDGKPLTLLGADEKATNSFVYEVPTDYHATVSLAAGAHTLRVQYFQIDGYKTLQVRLKPAK